MSGVEINAASSVSSNARYHLQRLVHAVDELLVGESEKKKYVTGKAINQMTGCHE